MRPIRGSAWRCGWGWRPGRRWWRFPPGRSWATREVFAYQVLDPVSLKGKAAPMPVYRALASRARLGTDVTRPVSTPMVGRQIDLGIVTGAFAKAVQESAVQLVVVAGEPGVGKSRLAAELLAFADSWPELVRWRQGRCLPYGEGITFWALGEIVRAEAGILETDAPDVAAAKIDAVIPGDAPDAGWLRARLRPLAGLSAPQAAREENFAAWRGFAELLAQDRPTVLVFEDLPSDRWKCRRWPSWAGPMRRWPSPRSCSATPPWPRTGSTRPIYAALRR